MKLSIKLFLFFGISVLSACQNGRVTDSNPSKTTSNVTSSGGSTITSTPPAPVTSVNLVIPSSVVGTVAKPTFKVGFAALPAAGFKVHLYRDSCQPSNLLETKVSTLNATSETIQLSNALTSSTELVKFFAAIENATGQFSTCSTAIANYQFDNVPPSAVTNWAIDVEMGSPTTTPKVSGNGDAGAIVKLFSGSSCGSQLGSVAIVTSSFMVNLSAMAVGTYPIHYKIYDLAGNSSACSTTGLLYTVTSGTVTPVTPTATQIDLLNGADMPVIPNATSSNWKPALFKMMNLATSLLVAEANAGQVVNQNINITDSPYNPDSGNPCLGSAQNYWSIDNGGAICGGTTGGTDGGTGGGTGGGTTGGGTTGGGTTGGGTTGGTVSVVNSHQIYHDDQLVAGLKAKLTGADFTEAQTKFSKYVIDLAQNSKTVMPAELSAPIKMKFKNSKGEVSLLDLRVFDLLVENAAVITSGTKAYYGLAVLKKANSSDQDQKYKQLSEHRILGMGNSLMVIGGKDGAGNANRKSSTILLDDVNKKFTISTTGTLLKEYTGAYAGHKKMVPVNGNIADILSLSRVDTVGKCVLIANIDKANKIIAWEVLKLPGLAQSCGTVMVSTCKLISYFPGSKATVNCP
jgi:hypothetical protein